MRREKDALSFSLERGPLYVVNSNKGCNMINRTKGLLYIPFIYFKGDVFAVAFHMQVFILELLMLWGISHSTCDHEYDSHLFVVKAPKFTKKILQTWLSFQGQKSLMHCHHVDKQIAPVFTNRLRVQEAAHRSRTHSCFNARAPGEQLPSLMSFSVGMNRHWSKFMWLSESTHITLLFEKQISPLQKKPENIIPTALASVEAELFLHVQ